MREIKFRAWDLVAKKFYYVDVWSFHILAENCDDVQQFTGLHDKNGKEIYEGDILKIGYGYAEQADSYIVEDLRELYADTQIDDSYCFITSMKIIGNMYENPELLKEDV